MTTYQETAAALEAEIAGIILDLDVAKREQAELEAKVAELKESFLDIWERTERDFAPLFGLTGVYPEIPEYWFPIVFRMCQRIKAGLTDPQFRCLRIMRVKEKFGCLDITIMADHDEIEGATLDDSDTAWIVACKLVDAAIEEAERLSKLRKNLM